MKPGPERDEFIRKLLKEGKKCAEIDKAVGVSLSPGKVARMRRELAGGGAAPRGKLTDAQVARLTQAGPKFPAYFAAQVARVRATMKRAGIHSLAFEQSGPVAVSRTVKQEVNL